MKLAIAENLRRSCGLPADELEKLGFRGTETIVTEKEPEPTTGLPPAILQTSVCLGDADDRISESVWRGWFGAAKASGAQGVAVTVKPGGERDVVVGARIRTLAALASGLGSKLLLAVRGDEGEPVNSHEALLDSCRISGGEGIGLILDVEAAALAAESPVKLLRAGEGYVQHVRLPTPAWARVSESVIVSVLRELQRISYIDYIALFGREVPGVSLSVAVRELRRAIVTAWVR